MKNSKLFFAGMSFMFASHVSGQFAQTITTVNDDLTNSGWGQTLELIGNSNTNTNAALVFSDVNPLDNDAFFIGGLSTVAEGNAYFGFLDDRNFNGTTAPIYSMSLCGENSGIFQAGDIKAYTNLFVQQSAAIGTFSAAPTATLDVFGDARIRQLPSSTGSFNVVTVDNNGVLYSTPQNSLTAGDLDWVVSGTTSTVPTSLSDNIRTNGLVGIGMNPVSTYTHSGGTLTNVTLSVNGTVYSAGGQFVTSDSRLKEDINELEGALFNLNQINGYSYSFKETNSYGLNLPTDVQLGVLAQEVQAVFPEAVVETESGHLAVNYDMLIPVLIESIQELSSELESLQSESMAQKNTGLVDNKTAISTVYPNPASTLVIFDLNLNDDYQSATILITDLSGKKIDALELNNTGEFSSEYNVSQLSDGIYVYNLIIDGKIIDSKKFVKDSSSSK